MQRLTRLGVCALAAAAAVALTGTPAHADEIPGGLLGERGTVISSEEGRWVLAERHPGGETSVTLYNGSTRPQRIATSVAEIGMPAVAPAYRVRDQATGADTHTAGVLAGNVPPGRALVLRVAHDTAWATYPPFVELDLQAPGVYPGGAALIEPGATSQVGTVVVNHGRTPAANPVPTLRVPQDWTSAAVSPPATAPLEPGRQHVTLWKVTAPEDLPRDAYRIDAAFQRLTAGAMLVVPPPAPTATAHLTDLKWLANGILQRGKVTLNGTTFARSLGGVPPGATEYYLAGRCTRFTAHVGVDDASGAGGSVTFEVWADSKKVAETGVLTGAMPAQQISADLTGARLVRLVVTEGGDGAADDRAAWGDAVVTC
ncbi:NPCBM/NEW2 domain-containing protein [Nonomuraea longicatena]|uniref:Glycosyl hydrolase family 98 putative carbohydrate-binding module domain-containing protein n=1 Tax=Nonomuraea longicatena TaxID=83682 RepID=A0ABP4A8D7_9ACTN